MELKLVQRIAISYYKTKFKAIGALSPKKAAESALTLFCTPYNRNKKYKRPPVFHKAQPLRFSFDGLELKGFRFAHATTNGKRILICHGFDSCSYKFEKYVTGLQKEGFEVLAFDAPAHGLSPGKTINALIYSRAILGFIEQFGAVDGIMAHSLGGLAVALAIEQLTEKHPQKIVLIAPATETQSSINQFLHFIPLVDKTKEEFIQLIQQLAQKPISWFSVTRAVQNIPSNILWIHDKDDKICPYTDTIPAQQLQLPHVQFMITETLGHNKIYREQKVSKEIINFFATSF
jgi:pimeloyl-ACP methyl ester carboxylesterase